MSDSYEFATHTPASATPTVTMAMISGVMLPPNQSAELLQQRSRTPSLYSPRHNNSGWSDVGPPAEYKTSCLGIRGNPRSVRVVVATGPATIFGQRDSEGASLFMRTIQYVIVGLALCIAAACSGGNSSPSPTSPTPTAAPAVLPEPVAAPHVTISDLGVRRDVFVGRIVFGTIRNTGNVEIGIPTSSYCDGCADITARFYASNGTLLEQSSLRTPSLGLHLQVGASETFAMDTFYEPADYFRMEVTDGDGQTIPCTGCGPIGL